MGGLRPPPPIPIELLETEAVTGNDTRRQFLEYFHQRGHRIVRSSSLVPAGDPTLLFTNAGMNQFKDVFLGQEKRDYLRATTSQKCVRAGGKHNDFENVGKTARHHTFFEMLGNFSFGDYFKSEAIPLAWELVTEVYGLQPEQLWITVYRDDDDAHRIWNRDVGVGSDRIFRLGEKDNFWAMGDTGPCGPCSEIHYDQGPAGSEAGHSQCSFPCECGRFVEIWNLVFMEFDRQSSGQLVPLPKPSVDTGMGLERMTAVLQGKHSNYDTDLLKPLTRYAAEISGRDYGSDKAADVSMRVIADHARATAFLVSDGVTPDNDGRGYVLRKIMRRAIRHGRLIGIEDEFLHRMADRVADLMQDAYPELASTRDYVSRVVRHEEQRFSSTLRIALDQLGEVLARLEPSGSHRGRLPGEVMFKFYDTYGLPLDLMQEIADENGLILDEEGFNRRLTAQRERGRASWKETAAAAGSAPPPTAGKTRFLGYSRLDTAEAIIQGILIQGRQTDSLPCAEVGEIFLDQTPFYAETGGQVGDTGVLRGAESEAVVQDTYPAPAGYSAHRVRCARGALQVGDRVEARVEGTRRDSIRKNHTATHLLHAALRQLVGFHVKQSGSLVAPDRLRFDFTHYAALSPEDLIEIEDLVNRKVMDNLAVTTRVQDLNQAVSEGAMALFGEKYGEQVRVVSVNGFSKELCGGTHVNRTGDIGLFKIVSESGIAAGVRRIEAITGAGALRRFREDEDLLSRLEGLFKGTRPELEGSVRRAQASIRSLEKELQETRYRLAQDRAGQLLHSARSVNDFKVLTAVVDRLDKASLRNLADELKSRIGRGVVVLATSEAGKVSLVAAITSDLTPPLHAGRMVKEIAALVGGGGGGRPDLAEAGGKDPSKLSLALEAVAGYVARHVEGAG